MEPLLLMENGKIKLMLRKLIGLLKTDNLTITKENIFILMYKSGKTKQVGGVQLSKAM